MSRAPDVARLLLCEDSRTYAAALRVFLEHDPDLRVVGTCVSGAEVPDAVERFQPDLLIMDLELPDGSGLGAIKRLLARRPTRILVLSAHAGRGSQAAAAALAAGAIDVRSKDELRLRDPSSDSATAFRRLVKRLSRARVRDTRSPPARLPSRIGIRRPVAAVGVCASTGGPAALREVLAALPSGFPVPMLVVQHMSEGFLEGFIDWLAAEVALPVRLASAGARLAPGVWFAPDGAHLVIDEALRMRLDRRTTEGYHMPSADILFHSLASALGAHCATVVLTGMGSDGADGTAAVRAAGGITVAQDESSSSIYGMPRSARARGAEVILPLEAIGPALAGLSLPGRGDG